MEFPGQDRIFTLGEDDFLSLALETFRFQYAGNPLYRDFTGRLGIDPSRVRRLSDIPFLPIEFFRQDSIQTTAFSPEMIFESSGTTQALTSRHRVKSLDLYRHSFLSGFEQFYGNPGDWCILGLLPSYLERENSSLVFMVDELIRRSGHPDSGFYLHEGEQLAALLHMLEKKNQKTLLIGVSFALVDFAQAWPMPLRHTVVMETGGMKGRRREMTREELHGLLKKQWGLDAVHSEYGMTELLSQAYSRGEGIFHPVPWMRVLLRGEDDPLSVRERGEGLINVIDLANLYSCSFIATDDLGRISSPGSFEVLGRMDRAGLRGCSLLVY